MGFVEAKVHVAARNELGQFIRECEVAATGTVHEMVTDGEKISRRLAPRGSKQDSRTIPIRESMFSEMFGRTNGRWGARARHALFQEKGTSAHTMIGNPFFSFFWENAGRMWVPGLMGEIDIINHPGHGPQPYLEPALAIVAAKFPQIARRYYPG
jgi:hypothetical protein